jgi:hypothetical protein
MPATAVRLTGTDSPDPHRQSRIENLEDQITELAAHIHAATYQLLVLIREYDQCKGWSQPGLLSCAHWLNFKCGISLGAAREKVRTANALKALPGISAAFEHGRISYSKVRAMTRVATPDNEGVLLQIALHGTATHVERAVRGYRKAKRLEALQLENRCHDLRGLSWHLDDGGFWVLKGRFTSEQGALIQAALESMMEELFRESQDVPAGTPTPDVTPRSEPVAQRRADALVRLAERSTRNAGERCCVHVHTDVETLMQDGSGSEAELEGQDTISAETTRRLACDAAVIKWLDGNDGEPLAIGRRSRSIPPAIRRALQRRDGGCRFPGCTCSRFVDAHHVRHWADGGETSMDNLVLLCRRHHRMVHEGGFRVAARAGGRFEFSDQSGKLLSMADWGRSRGNVTVLKTSNSHAGVLIDHRTTIPAWHGEEMDDELAVLGLIQKD